LTNFRTVRASIKRLKDLEDMAETNNYEKISKKEILQLSREQEKLHKTLGGIKEMGGLPDVLFVIDVGYEKIAVQEASKLGIPVVGIVDTNNSPDNIDYIVPGNDDSMRAIKLYTKMVADAVLEGKQSIAGGLDGDAELIEVGPEDASADAKPSVKITAKKSAAAKPVASEAPTAEAVAEAEPTAEVEAADVVAEAEPVAEPEVAEAVVDSESNAEPAVAETETAATVEEPEAEAEKAAVVEEPEAEVEKAAVVEEPEAEVEKAAAVEEPEAEAEKAVTKKAAPKKAATKKAATKKAATKKAATKKAVSED
jgi:small subunit ribosomal protein S2